MSSNVKVTINVEIDGQQVEGYPLIKRLTVDELQQFNYEKATGGGYVALPVDQLSNIQFLVLKPTEQITLRLDAQTDAGIVIAANGIVLLVGVTIDDGTTRATIDNSSGAIAVIKGIGGGT